MKTTALWIILALALLCLSGCVHLNTWQRGVLMSPVMQDAPSGLELRIENHMHSVREGMMGSTSGSGSPCGCN